MITVKLITEPEKKSQITNTVLRELPQWFGVERSILDYVAGVKATAFYAAFAGDRCVGFISSKENNSYTAEIYVMGITPAYHRKGIGRLLYNSAEAHSQDEGYKMFMVKTVGESCDYEPYKKTREFYIGVGFLPLEEIKEIWDEENPCLILVKCLTCKD